MTRKKRDHQLITLLPLSPLTENDTSALRFPQGKDPCGIF